MILEFPDELERAIRGRPGWKVEGRAAIYTSPAGTHTVRVQLLAQPYRRDEKWNASMIVGGVARHATTHFRASSAVDWAEKVRPA